MLEGQILVLYIINKRKQLDRIEIEQRVLVFRRSSVDEEMDINHIYLQTL